MELKDMFVLIPIGIMIIAAIYMNFIFPRKVEKEERQKEENEKRK